MIRVGGEGACFGGKVMGLTRDFLRYKLLTRSRCNTLPKLAGGIFSEFFRSNLPRSLNMHRYNLMLEEKFPESATIRTRYNTSRGHQGRRLDL